MQLFDRNNDSSRSSRFESLAVKTIDFGPIIKIGNVNAAVHNFI